MKKSFIRLGLISLAVLMILPYFAACTEDPISEESTFPPETTEIPDTEPVKTDVVISPENAGSVNIIRSQELRSGSLYVKLCIDFRKELEKRLSAKLNLKDDFMMPNQTIDPDAPEIIVGDTIREESIALNEKIAATGKNSYGIYVKGQKIAVGGTSPHLVYLALEYLLKNFIFEDASGNKQLKLEDGFEYIETAEYNYPTPSEVINSGRDFAFYTVEKIAKIPTTSGFTTVQGGGSDGKYAYYCVINKSTSPETAIIHKFDMSTWELVATSGTIESMHSNDIAYDSKNHRLVISCCSSSDNYRGLVFVDPDTLKSTGYIIAPTAGRAIDYIPEKNQYIIATNYSYFITNENFETIDVKPDGFPQLTTQGFCTDGEIIYDPRWDNKASHQTISVNTVDGKFIGAVPLYDIVGEPESIFIDGDTFIMGCNNSNAVYRLVLTYTDWWN